MTQTLHWQQLWQQRKQPYCWMQTRQLQQQQRMAAMEKLTCHLQRGRRQQQQQQPQKDFLILHLLASLRSLFWPSSKLCRVVARFLTSTYRTGCCALIDTQHCKRLLALPLVFLLLMQLSLIFPHSAALCLLLLLLPIPHSNPAFSPAWNQGCLGARLSELVQGDISLALVSNYMFDWDFFPLHCCPGLLQAKQVGAWWLLTAAALKHLSMKLYFLYAACPLAPKKGRDSATPRCGLLTLAPQRS